MVKCIKTQIIVNYFIVSNKLNKGFFQALIRIVLYLQLILVHLIFKLNYPIYILPFQLTTYDSCKNSISFIYSDFWRILLIETYLNWKSVLEIQK